MSNLSERFARRKQELEKERQAKMDKIQQDYDNQKKAANTNAASLNKKMHPAEDTPLNKTAPIMSLPKQGDPKKLGLINTHQNTFNQPLPSKDLLRSNPAVRAFDPTKTNKLSAGLQQIQHGMQSAVAFQQRPTNEVPTTGNKTADNLLKEAGGFLPGLMSGQTEAEVMGGVSKGAQYIGAKLLPKLPIFNKIAGHAVEAGVENARVGAAAGQTDASQVRDNFLYGGAFGAGGSGLKEGVQGLKRFATGQAEELVGKQLSRANTNIPLRWVPRPSEPIPNTEPIVPAPLTQATKPRMRVMADRGPLPEPQAPVNAANEVKQGIEQISPAVATKPIVKPTPTPREPKLQEPKPQVETGTRANYANQLDNGNFSPELQDRIKKADQTYTKVTNADDAAQALTMVQQDLEGTLTKFMSHNEGGSLHTAIGYQLMKRLDAMGKHDQAAMVSDKLAADLTDQGQGSQAAVMLKALSPEGQLIKLIKKATKNGKEVTPEIQAKFKNEVRKSQKADGSGVRDNLYNSVLNKLKKGEEPTAEDVQAIEDYLKHAEETVANKSKPKAKTAPKTEKPKVETPNIEETVPELKQPKKREKVVSFFDAQEKAALARIASRKNRLNSIPIPDIVDHSIVLASQLAKGSIHAATYIEDLVREYGEEGARLVAERAEKVVKTVARKSSEDKMDEALQAFDEVTGKAAKEKAIVEAMAEHVKQVIEDAKQGKTNPDDIQKMRDYADEIAKMLEGKPTREISAEKRYLQNVKSLAKKIAEVQSKKLPTDQANKEISSLIRKVANDPAVPKEKRVKMDMKTDKALSNIASNVMKRTRPTEKPTTLQEKIVEQYIKKAAKEKRAIPESSIAKLRQIAKDVTALDKKHGLEADIEMQKIMNSYEKSSVWDKYTTISYLMMLGNEATQVVNILSGPMMATAHWFADLVPAMVDSLMHRVFNTKRNITLYGTNPLRFIAHWFQNMGTGMKAGWHGVNPEGIQSISEVRGLAFKGKYNPLGWGERTLGAVSKGADYATYKTVKDAELKKAGYIDAVNSGVKGRENIKEHIQQFVNDPSAAALKESDRMGRKSTFQLTDSVGAQIARMPDMVTGKARFIVKPLKLATVPFLRTPLNMGSAGVTMSPFGLLKGLFQLTKYSEVSRREALQTLGLSAVTGTAGLSSLGYYLNSVGIITGSNDSGNKNVNSIGEQAGEGKYLFNTSALMRYLTAILSGKGLEAAEEAAKYQRDDNQFDYNKMQPLALPLTLGASFQEGKKLGVTDRLSKMGEDAYLSLLSMSPLKTLQSILQPDQNADMTEGEKQMALPRKIAESFAKELSPSLLAQEARRQDRTVRATSYNKGFLKDVGDYYQSRLPKSIFGIPNSFNSSKLPPSKTTLGQDKLNPPGFKGTYFNPYKSNTAPYNDAAPIIYDLIKRTGDNDLAPKPPDKKVTGKDSSTGLPVVKNIPPDRYAQLQEELGNDIIKQITSLDSSLSDADKVEKIKKIYTDTRHKYMNKIKKEMGIKVTR